MKDRYHEACETIRSYGEAGAPVIQGRKNDEGEFIEISPIEWPVLTLESYPRQIGATALAREGGWPRYRNLTFEREALMRLSPSENDEPPSPSTVIKVRVDPVPEEKPPRGYDDTDWLDEMARLMNGSTSPTRNAASELVAPRAEPASTADGAKAKRLRVKFNEAYEFRKGRWVKLNHS